MLYISIAIFCELVCSYKYIKKMNLDFRTDIHSYKYNV